MNTRLILTVTFLLFLYAPLSFLNAQNKSGYVISGNIIGLRDSTKITLSDPEPSKTKNTFSKSGQFSFTGTVPVKGMSPSITIEGLEGSVTVILDNQSKININCKTSEWGSCIPTGSKAQEELNNFQDKIQRPFSKAWDIYRSQIVKITGSKNPLEFFNQIPAHLPIVDSLRIALVVQTYQNAVINYPKDTMEWLCNHTDALYAPRLIQEWWPASGWTFIYNALTPEVKNSHHGQILKKAIDQMSQPSLKQN